jgi:hypothetical protein
MALKVICRHYSHHFHQCLSVQQVNSRCPLETGRPYCRVGQNEPPISVSLFHKPWTCLRPLLGLALLFKLKTPDSTVVFLATFHGVPAQSRPLRFLTSYNPSQEGKPQIPSSVGKKLERKKALCERLI